jgi:hypothetical protein
MITLDLDLKIILVTAALIIGAVIIVPLIFQLKTKIGASNVRAAAALVGISDDSIRALVTKVIDSVDVSKIKDDVYIVSLVMNQIYVILNKLNGDTMISVDHYNLEVEKLLQDLSELPRDTTDEAYKQRLINLITTHICTIVF